MFVSGFMGSPRRKGNTQYLLNLLLEKLENHGATTEFIDVTKKNILPCTGCGHCERKGTCPLDDDMGKDILPVFKKSDLIIIASPVYFYTVPSQLKAMIDRSQTLWARKYALNIYDPSEKSRKGFMLSVAATNGKALFDCIDMTLKYFFDAIGADFNGKLTYGGIEGPGEIKNHPTVLSDIENTASKLAELLKKKTILFTCSQNTGRSQMAGAFARKAAGDKFNILTAGSMPADKIEPEIEQAMAEKGIDIGFRKPESIDSATNGIKPDFVITINSGEETCINIPGSNSHIWIIDDPTGKPVESISKIRDQIEEKVNTFLAEFK